LLRCVVARRTILARSALYVLYVLYLLLDTNDHSATSVVGPAVFFVASLSLLGFSVTGYQGWRRHRATVKAQQR
jgi:hypothetical protein